MHHQFLLPKIHGVFLLLMICGGLQFLPPRIHVVRHQFLPLLGGISTPCNQGHQGHTNMYDIDYILIAYSHLFVSHCIMGLQTLGRIHHHFPCITIPLVLIVPTPMRGITIIMVVIIHHITGVMTWSMMVTGKGGHSR